MMSAQPLPATRRPGLGGRHRGRSGRRHGHLPARRLGRIAAIVEADEGAGAVPDAIDAAIKRLIAFEMQLGPFAVANLRILAELLHLMGKPPKTPPRMFVTDTLGNPYIEQEWLPAVFAPIAESRKQANKIKLKEPITVVIGNPPYKEKAKGRGGWIEDENSASGAAAPLDAWMPPRDWGVGAHASTCATSTSTSGAGRLEGVRPRSQGQHGHRLLHHRRGFPQRPGLSENARLPPPHRRRDLGHRLLARRPSARSQHAHLPGRSAARLHRAGVAIRRSPIRTRRPRSATSPCPKAAAKRSSLLWASSPLTAMLGPIARPIGVPRFCQPRPVRGPPIRRLKTFSPTTAPASCPAELGSSPPMPIVARAAGRLSSRRRPNGRKRCLFRISARANWATGTSTESWRRDCQVTQTTPEADRRANAVIASRRCDTASARSTASGSSRTTASSIGPTRNCGEHTRRSRFTYGTRSGHRHPPVLP